MYAQPLPDNSMRAKNAQLMMMLTMILYAVSTIFSLVKVAAMDTLMDNYKVTQFTEGGLGILQFTIEIITIVLFIMWFRRAYNNLFICGVRGLPYSEGWAAGAWFVPIISLFYPYRIMNSIWDETQRALRNTGEHYDVRTDGNIGWWWAFWITGSIIANVQVQMTLRGEYGDYDSTIVGMDLISNAASLVAAYLCWQMIRKTSEMESELQQRYQEWMAWQTQQQAQQFQQQQGFPTQQ